jgi:hypothetical protein
MRDHDQLGARTDRALECGEVELPRGVVVEPSISAAAVSSAPIPDLPVLASERGGWVKGDSLTGREFRRLRVGCQQFRKARGIAARHAGFGGYVVDPARRK